MLEGYASPIMTDCKTPSELIFTLPKLDKIEVGQRLSISLLPPSGAPIVSTIYIEVVDVGKGEYVVNQDIATTDPSLVALDKQEPEVKE